MQNQRPRTSSSFYGYVVVMASFVIMAVASGTQLSFSVFVEPLQEHFGWSRATTAGAVSAVMFSYGVFSIGGGRLSDRFGPRLVLTVSGLLFGFAFLMMSRMSSIWQFYASYGVVYSAAYGAVLVPLTSTVARWFYATRGLMTGIVLSGAGAGTMLVPPLANWLIYRTDWRTAYEVIGFVLMVVVILAAQFLRRNPSATAFGPLAADKRAGEATAQTSRRTGDLLCDAVRTRQFWLLCATLACFGYAVQSVLVHVVIHTRGLGFSPAGAAKVMTVIGGCSFAGRIAWGGLADRLGPRWLLPMALTTLSIDCFGLAIARQDWTIYVFAVVFGSVYGGAVPLVLLRSAQLFGLRALGAITGSMMLGSGIASAAGPVLTGYGFDLLRSYTIPFAACGVVAALAALLAFSVRPIAREAPEATSASAPTIEV